MVIPNNKRSGVCLQHVAIGKTAGRYFNTF